MSKWIEFKEKMPKEGASVLLSTADGRVLYCENFSNYDYAASDMLTAWQYAPKPYKVIECGDEVTTPAGRGVVLYMEHDRRGNIVFAVLVPSGIINRFGRVDVNPTGKRWEKLADGFAEYMQEVNE